MLVIEIAGRPASKPLLMRAISGPGTGRPSGADPGHIGICVWPGDGCHAPAAAVCVANAIRAQRVAITSFIIKIKAGLSAQAALVQTRDVSLSSNLLLLRFPDS